MKWQGRRKSGNLEDRRSVGTKRKIVAGGTTVAVIVVLLQLFGGETGKEIAPILQEIDKNRTSAPSTQQRALTEKEQIMGDFMGTVLADTEDIWNGIFKAYTKSKN